MVSSTHVEDVAQLHCLREDNDPQLYCEFYTTYEARPDGSPFDEARNVDWVKIDGSGLDDSDVKNVRGDLSIKWDWSDDSLATCKVTHDVGFSEKHLECSS